MLVKGGLHVRPTHDNHPLSPVVTAPKVIQQFSREFGKRYRSQQTSSGKSASRLRSQVTFTERPTSSARGLALSRAVQHSELGRVQSRTTV